MIPGLGECLVFTCRFAIIKLLICRHVPIRLPDPPDIAQQRYCIRMNTTIIYTLTNYVAIFVFLSLAVHVRTHAQRQPITIAFSGFMIALVLYYVSGLFLIPPGPELPAYSVIAMRVAWAAGSWIPAFFFHSTYFYFSSGYRRRTKGLIYVFYMVSLLLSIATLLGSGLIFEPLYRGPGEILGTHAGLLMPFFIVYFASLMLISLVGMLQARRNTTSPTLRRQINYMLLPYGLMLLAGAYGWVVIYTGLDLLPIRLSDLLLIITGFIYSMVIVQYGSFSGRPSAVREVYYTVTFTLSALLVISFTLALDLYLSQYLVIPVPIITSILITIYLAGRNYFNPHFYAFLDRIFPAGSSLPASRPQPFPAGEILDPELLRSELLAALAHELQADGAFVAEVVAGNFVPEMDLDPGVLSNPDRWNARQVLQVSAVFGRLPLTPGQRLPLPEPFPREAAPVGMLTPPEREAHSWYGLALYGQLNAPAMPDAMLGVCSLQRSIGLNQQVRDTFEAYAHQLELAQQIIHLDQRRRRTLEQASSQEETIRKLEDRIQSISARDGSVKQAVPAHSPLRIRVLGPLEVVAGGRRVPDDAWKSERARELLAYLLWKGQAGASGTEIQEVLWLARGEEVSSNTVYVTINRLRKVLEPELGTARDSRYIRNESGRYFFDFDAPSWLDLTEYLRLVASDDLNELRQAVELYRGRYLENIGDFLPPDVEAYRRTLENDYIRILRRLIAGRHGQDDDLYLELLLAVEPLDDDANQLLVEHYLARGRDELALAHLGRYRQALEELDAEPSPSMRQLWRKVEQKVQQKL